MRCPRFAHHVARDDDLLDLRRLRTGGTPHVAVEALEAVFGHAAPPRICTSAARSATRPHISVANILSARCLGRDVLAVVAAACGVDGHALGGVQLGLAVGQHGLHQLEVADRLAELLAVERIASASRRMRLATPTDTAMWMRPFPAPSSRS